MYIEKKSFDDDIVSLRESMKRANWQGMTTLGFDNSAGTKLYDYQVEFCYLIDSIERDSPFIAGKMLPKARELISNLRKECAETKSDEA